jgi:hypothetical protein
VFDYFYLSLWVGLVSWVGVSAGFFFFLFLMGAEVELLKLEKEGGGNREKWLCSCIQLPTIWCGAKHGDSYS